MNNLNMWRKLKPTDMHERMKAIGKFLLKRERRDLFKEKSLTKKRELKGMFSKKWSDLVLLLLAAIVDKNS